MARVVTALITVVVFANLNRLFCCVLNGVVFNNDIGLTINPESVVTCDWVATVLRCAMTVESRIPKPEPPEAPEMVLDVAETMAPS